jgi:hypothetical protein
MGTCARANIKHSSGTTINGNLVQFGKSAWIKELSRVDWRVSDAVITPQDAVSIFFAVQIIKHCLSMKFHICHSSITRKALRSFGVKMPNELFMPRCALSKPLEIDNLWITLVKVMNNTAKKISTSGQQRLHRKIRKNRTVELTGRR